jgi:hypothetical protein
MHGAEMACAKSRDQVATGMKFPVSKAGEVRRKLRRPSTELEKIERAPRAGQGRRCRQGGVGSA